MPIVYNIGVNSELVTLAVFCTVPVSVGFTV